MKTREELLAYQKEYYQKNRKKVDDRTKAHYEKNVDKYLHLVAGKRAKKYGHEFDLDVADVVVPEVCPVFGTKLQRGDGRLQKASPSLDKIEPSKGYVRGNIQVIPLKANTMKQDATPEELRMFAKWVLKTFPEEPDGKK